MDLVSVICEMGAEFCFVVSLWDSEMMLLVEDTAGFHISDVTITIPMNFSKLDPYFFIQLAHPRVLSGATLAKA